MPITINGSGTVTGISAGGLPDGVITTDDLAANAVTYAKIGTIEQGQLCKAWVNFNGTGTVAIRASYNVSSITDNGVGAYNINMTTALPDTNYCVQMNCWSASTAIYIMGSQTHVRTFTSSTFPITVSNGTALGADNGDGFADVVRIFVSVFR